MDCCYPITYYPPIVSTLMVLFCDEIPLIEIGIIHAELNELFYEAGIPVHYDKLMRFMSIAKKRGVCFRRVAYTHLVSLVQLYEKPHGDNGFRVCIHKQNPQTGKTYNCYLDWFANQTDARDHADKLVKYFRKSRFENCVTVFMIDEKTDKIIYNKRIKAPI